ncbi:MAG: DNA internalization-related competence protein ComEC/Rec2 [Casimicrobiaceae bacterium]
MHSLPAALAGFAAGCVALQWQPTLPAAGTYALAALVILVAARLAHVQRPCTALRRFVVPGLVIAAMTCAGFDYAAWRADVRLADALSPDWEGSDLTLVGVIDDLPTRSPQGTRFAFAVQDVLTAGATVPNRLSLAWYPAERGKPGSDVPRLRAGEQWRLTVRLKRPHGNVNPHGYDLEAWLLQNGLRATGYVRMNADNARLADFAGRVSDHVQRTRENIRDRGAAALAGAAYAGVIVALAIGEQRAIPEAQWLVFNRTGITHLISISGLHVTIFAALVAAVVYALARRSVWLTTRTPARRVAALAGAFAAFGYMLLAGAQVPAQRTFVMLAVAAAGLWLGRPGTARMVWLWALAIVLLFDPWAGLTPGFWLSFAAVGLLLYAGTARLHSPSLAWTDSLARSLRAAAHAQVVVTVGLVPLTLAVFQQVSLVTPVANALAIPVVTFAVVPLALAAIVLPVDWLWQLAHGVFACLMVPLVWLAQLPGATWQQHAPAAWAVVTSLAGVLLLLAPPGVPLRAFGALWFSPLFVVEPPMPAHGDFEITVLDVGQGLAVAVRTRLHTLLYDAGPRYTDEADAGSRVIAPFLRASGIRRLSALVVSHLDSDHSGGARSLLQTVPVARLLSSVRHSEPLWWGAPGDVVRCRDGQRWTWDGVEFTMLHPAPEAYASLKPKTNDMSCVLRIESASGSILLTGDIEARSEAALIARHAPLRADAIVVPHHGSRTSSTPAFVESTAPRVAIFTAGYRNRFGHPRADVIDRYRAGGAVIARTDLQGAITVRFRHPGVPEVSAARDRQRRYWYDTPEPTPGSDTETSVPR